MIVLQQLATSIAKSRSLTESNELRVESEKRGAVVAVDRKGSASQRRGAERRDVQAFAGVDKTAVVAFEHLVPSQHMMAEANRLRRL